MENNMYTVVSYGSYKWETSEPMSLDEARAFILDQIQECANAEAWDNVNELLEFYTEDDKFIDTFRGEDNSEFYSVRLAAEEYFQAWLIRKVCTGNEVEKILDEIRWNTRMVNVAHDEYAVCLQEEYISTFTERIHVCLEQLSAALKKTPVAVVSHYSFDVPQVDLFASDEEAKKYLKETATAEYKIDSEQNQWLSDIEFDETWESAKITNSFPDHDDITEFEIAGTVFDHRT